MRCSLCSHLDVCRFTDKEENCIYFKPVRLEGHCTFCEDRPDSMVTKIELSYTRINPIDKKPGGYSWVDQVRVNRCPVCGRELKGE